MVSAHASGSNDGDAQDIWHDMSFQEIFG